MKEIMGDGIRIKTDLNINHGINNNYKLNQNLSYRKILRKLKNVDDLFLENLNISIDDVFVEDLNNEGIAQSYNEILKEFVEINLISELIKKQISNSKNIEKVVEVYKTNSYREIELKVYIPYQFKRIHELIHFNEKYAYIINNYITNYYNLSSSLENLIYDKASKINNAIKCYNCIRSELKKEGYEYSIIELIVESSLEGMEIKALRDLEGLFDIKNILNEDKAVNSVKAKIRSRYGVNHELLEVISALKELNPNKLLYDVYELVKDKQQRIINHIETSLRDLYNEIQLSKEDHQYPSILKYKFDINFIKSLGIRVVFDKAKAISSVENFIIDILNYIHSKSYQKNPNDCKDIINKKIFSLESIKNSIKKYSLGYELLDVNSKEYLEKKQRYMSFKALKDVYIGTSLDPEYVAIELLR